MKRWSSRRDDERGVSLVLVLVTLVVFGLLVPILGQFGSTNGVSGYLLEGQRYDRYAAEAGVQEAIAWAQAERVAGRNKVPCGNLTDSLQPGSSRSARTVRVSCQGFRGSGEPQATPTIPQYALLTLNGGNVSVSGRAMRTDGAWYSSGGIDASGTRLDATHDYVGAAGSCSGLAVTNTAPFDCGTGRAGIDPGYDVPIPGLPFGTPVDPKRARCAGIVNGVARIDPGLHWQRDYFNALGDGDCGDVTIWLAPGDGTVPHLFDFTFYGSTNQPSWTIDTNGRRIRVVSGTPVGNNPSAGCEPDGPAAAVIAAGGFWLQPTHGAVLDLCGERVGRQRVAMTQVTRGTNPVETTSSPALVSRVTSAPPTFFPAVPPGSAAPLANVDCVPRTNCTADKYLSGTVNGRRNTATVSLTVPDPVPAGAYLKWLTIGLTHRERENRGGDLRRLRVWISGMDSVYDCGLTDNGNTLESSSDWTTADPRELTCVVDYVHQPYASRGPLQINVAVDTGEGNGDNRPDPSVELDLDQVSLTAKFVPAGTRDSRPTGPVLQIHDPADPTFQGTVYLPTGDVTADLSGASSTSGFRRGLIARNVTLEGVPGDPQYAPFSLPNGGSYTDRTVTFAATLADGSYGDASKVILSARVLFCDPQPDEGPAKPPCTGAPDQDPVVLSWDPTR